MPKHRRGVLTLYQPATPLRPKGHGGTGPSPALALLDVTHGYARRATPWIWHRGARNGTRRISSTAFEGPRVIYCPRPFQEDPT